MTDARLTLGPLLFNWPAERYRDFYYRIADEAPVDRVCLGEVVCSKRTPFVQDSLPSIIDRLESGGKEVVLSTLALPTLDREMKYTAGLASSGRTLEINDVSQIALVRGRPFHVGPLLNVYNEATVEYLAALGACAIALPPELSRPSIAAIAAASRRATIEVWAFGRVPLAISARCYHARVHNLTKDSCQFVCERDADGLTVETLDAQGFLAINGVQTLSHTYCNVIDDVVDLARTGVASFRLSPHSCDMVAVATTFRSVLAGKLGADEAMHQLSELKTGAPFSNGFVHGTAGAACV
ncbi:MAG: U32 family peptidase [Hyphomicrobiaceae bacterium]|nr:MAG: U32 family peptidase [Hyphomicrobiaceae bacterium]